METLTIRRSTVAEIEQSPNITQLLAEYADESAIAGIGVPMAQLESYHQMEAAGLLHAIAAWQGTHLVGFVTLISGVLPHYGVCTATTESFFVARASRKTGAGLGLLREAEHLAKDLGAKGLLVSAPFGGRLAEVLPKAGYTETNRVFFRGLA
jgi:GNAT superfamily N-acetyltransferase